MGKFTLILEDNDDGTVNPQFGFEGEKATEDGEPTLAAIAGYLLIRFLQENLEWNEEDDEPAPQLELVEDPPEENLDSKSESD